MPRSVLPSARPPVLTRPGPVGCGPGCGVCPSAALAQLSAPTSVPSVFWAGRWPRASGWVPRGQEGCSYELPGARKGAQPAFRPGTSRWIWKWRVGAWGLLVFLCTEPPDGPQLMQNPGVALAPQLCAGQSVAGATGLGPVGHRVPKRAGQDREGEAFPQVQGPD